MVSFIVLSALTVATLVTASPLLEARAACGETATRVCYNTGGGTPQNITLDDINYAAYYLRYLGTQNAGKAEEFWTMPAAIDCAEWTMPLPPGGTVLALAKHINPRIKSAVSFLDMANTIDGGENASDAAKKAALLGCDTNGGQMGVIVDTNNARYSSDVYKALNAKPQGIIIKLVKDPNAPN